MTEQEIKLKCLEIAASTDGKSAFPKTLIEIAKAYYTYITSPSQDIQKQSSLSSTPSPDANTSIGSSHHSAPQ